MGGHFLKQIRVKNLFSISYGAIEQESYVVVVIIVVRVIVVIVVIVMVGTIVVVVIIVILVVFVIVIAGTGITCQKIVNIWLLRGNSTMLLSGL